MITLLLLLTGAVCLLIGFDVKDKIKQWKRKRNK